jgi:hypothetical protein
VSRGPYYILDGHAVVPASLEAFGRWFERANRVVDYTEVTSQVRVSTVFLGIDHRWLGKGPPIVFETMIFGGPLDGDQWRYSSWDDAEAGHKAAVRKARAAIRQEAD